MILLMFAIFCILFYRIYLFYGITTIFWFEVFCLIYYFLSKFMINELSKQDKKTKKQINK